ncbi:hypothetical protein [Candidatus Bandiella numerosa]|nr:hypothetical protein [Candidatus Bandiella numerosa]
MKLQIIATTQPFFNLKGRCINAKQGRYAINGFKKLDSYKEER